jgi:hypothetical protein
MSYFTINDVNQSIYTLKSVLKYKKQNNKKKVLFSNWFFFGFIFSRYFRDLCIRKCFRLFSALQFVRSDLYIISSTN